MNSKEQVIYTAEVPQCTTCKEPTQRSYRGSTSTLMAYTPTYNEDGININPDKNTITAAYKCHRCENFYTVKGNNIDGFKYGK